MEAAKNRWRLWVLTGVVILCFGGLGCWLVDLQWKRHDEFAALAENLHEHSYYREATRGDIRDRRGHLLATSVPVKTVCADPYMLKDYRADMAHFLAPLLKTNEEALLHLLGPSTRTNTDGTLRPNQYVRLKHRVSLEDWEKIRTGLQVEYTNRLALLLSEKPRQNRSSWRDFRWDFWKARRSNGGETNGARVASFPVRKAELQAAWARAITIEDDQIRVYPNAHLAAHVLGFLGYTDVVTNGITNSFAAGREGIEATFDPKLRGARGWVKTERDIQKRELFVFRDQNVESRPGLNVVLTLDARVQQIVEEELAQVIPMYGAQSTFAVVMKPRTGEILALANYPTFDPNMPGKSPEGRRNHAIGDAFEPGSTFKTVTLAGALDDGTAQLTDVYDCENGIFHFADPRQPLRDHEHFRLMTVREIIAKSSNIGTAKVAIKMGQERAYKHIVDFGFGQRTGLPLTGEASGYLPPLKYWRPISISRIPIGQGISATAVQSTLALCAVANGGVLMRPMLVDRLVDDKGHTVAKYEPQVNRRVISTAAAKTTIDALKTVVEKGTGDKAALEHYTVAGKTGTAQKVGPDGHYTHDKYFSSFIGFFPADQPELCVAVFIDEPAKKAGYYGGQIAAPIFKRISERAANFLNIKPDIRPAQADGVMAQVSDPVLLPQASTR